MGPHGAPQVRHRYLLALQNPGFVRKIINGGGLIYLLFHLAHNVSHMSCPRGVQVRAGGDPPRHSAHHQRGGDHRQLQLQHGRGPRMVTTSCTIYPQPVAANSARVSDTNVSQYLLQ